MMKVPTTLSCSLAAIALLVSGCGEPQVDEAPMVENAPPAVEAPSTDPAAQADVLQARLVAHMSVAREADVREFRQMWPEHQALVREMLDDCRAMMSQMGMTPPRQFTTVEEALESDLQRIPELGDAELEALLPDHLDRVQTVIGMRQDMMDDMS